MVIETVNSISHSQLHVRFEWISHGYSIDELSEYLANKNEKKNGKFRCGGSERQGNPFGSGRGSFTNEFYGERAGIW